MCILFNRSVTWKIYSRQEKEFNFSHLKCLRKINVVDSVMKTIILFNISIITIITITVSITTRRRRRRKKTLFQ